MKINLSICLLLITVLSYCQNEEKVFFDSNWEVIHSSTKCEYYRVIKYSETGQILMPIKDFYCKDNKLQSEFYSDTIKIQSIKYGRDIDEMEINTGKVIMYAENGGKEINYYSKGELINSLKSEESNLVDLTDKFDKYIIKENLSIRNKFVTKLIRELTNNSSELQKESPEKEEVYLGVLNNLKKDNELASKIMVYGFQKSPEQVVHNFFNAFKVQDYTSFNNLIDPYGATNKDTQEILLMMYYLNPILPKDMEKLPNMFKQINLEIINTTIKDNKAEVNINIVVKDKNIDGKIYLIQRYGYWFLENLGM